MDLDDLDDLINRSTKSAFRLETLPQYLVPQEAERFADWRAGKQLEDRSAETTPWLAEVQAETARGFRWYRVHIVDQPLCEYTRFELRSYLDSQRVGFEIYIADRNTHADLADLHEDFWLYDDEIAVRMVYDEEGHFLHPEMIDDVRPYRQIRDAAMKYAEPLDDYLARVKPKLTI